MVPERERLPVVTPTEHIGPDGFPAPEYRRSLRKIPNARNAATVASFYVQTFGIMALAVWWNHPAGWVIAFVLLGRAHAQAAALMHEAAHRLLFSRKRVNDWVGRWLLGYPSFVPIDLYRRGHMAHHRREFGPNEPDIALYRNYPISRDSMRRKLVRDATGQTGWKQLKGLLRGVRADEPTIRKQARAIVAVQVVLALVALALGHPFVYWLLWFGSWMTIWRVFNRLRSIAEHGGMVESDDRRETTHSVRQRPVARFLFAPYRLGFHLAHHVDAGVPMWRLGRLHRDLRTAGYVSDDFEYPSYLALWRALASGN